MEMKSWIRFPMAIGVLAWMMGCETPKTMEPKYLYLTSTMPDSLYWEVHSGYETFTDKHQCQDLSLGTGKWEHKTRREVHRSKGGGDTAKIPLFLEEPSKCEWTLTHTYIELTGNCATIRAVSFATEGRSGADSSAPQLPDSIAFNCTKDTNPDCVVCREVNGIRDLDYLVSKAKSDIRLHLKLEGP
jgi:hypothetical protein